MGATKNVTWQEYNGTDYDILLPQPSVATSEKVGGIIADTATVNPQFEYQFECKISQYTNKLLMPTSISPNILLSSVPITKGGTGAETKQEAVNNLGINDYIVNRSLTDNACVDTYNSGIVVLREKRFNSESITLSSVTEDGKWYKTDIYVFTPSSSKIGNMNKWQYWNLQAIPVGTQSSMPMLTQLQTGYNATSSSIPWRLFSTKRVTFAANQLLFVLTVVCSN